jgi:hypothetical protein
MALAPLGFARLALARSAFALLGHLVHLCHLVHRFFDTQIDNRALVAPQRRESLVALQAALAAGGHETAGPLYQVRVELGAATP